MKKTILKRIRNTQVVPGVIYGITCLNILLYLFGVKLVEDYWYFVLYSLCFFCLAFYKYKNVEFYLWDRKRLCLFMGFAFCLIAYLVDANSTTNYLYFSNSDHVVVIEEGSDLRDGYLDIYRKKLFFKLHLDRMETRNGSGSLTVELNPRGGHIFKGANSYEIGLFSFNLEDDETLIITYRESESITILLEPHK